MFGSNKGKEEEFHELQSTFLKALKDLLDHYEPSDDD
jgi:hypothetical protein